MTQNHPEKTDPLTLSTKLWIYSNYDCNLCCTYCVAESYPGAPKRTISLRTVKRITDEAVELGFEHIYFTGGEPFILDNIYDMLACTSDKLTTTVLTNAMLFRGRRLERLNEIKNESLTMQVSLDGSRPEHHDPFRGRGSWKKTMEGIRTLLEMDFHVRVSTTETPANTAYLDEICDYRRFLGIPDEDHIIRPLAKRGFSQDGMEVEKHNLLPELTINTQGVYWHPLSTDPDLLVSTKIFPLVEALTQVKVELEEISASQNSDMEEFQ